MAETILADNAPASGNTAQKTFHRAVGWAYLMNWGEKGFSALFTFVLASLLGPSQFGIVAMATIYIAFAQMFLEQGLVSALIQRKDLRDEHIDSVFWTNMTLSLLLLGITAGGSGLWAKVNHQPQLVWFICALSLAIPIEGLSIVPRALMLRRMDFRSLSIRSNASVMAGGMTGLFLAFRGYGPWALVGQRLTQDAVAVTLLWNLGHWRPRLRFSRKSLQELLAFSSANFLSKLSVFANVYCGALVLGVFMGPVAVGIYRLSERLMGIVLDLSTTSLQTVSLPQFSRVQDDSQEVRRSMLSLLRLSSTLALPLMAGLAAISLPLMRLLGTKWIPAADVVKVLCISGVVMAFAQFIGPLLQGISRPLLAAAITWGSTILSVAMLVTAALLLRHTEAHRQVLGITIVRVAADASILLPILAVVLHRFARIHLREFLGVIAPAAGSAAAAAGVVLGIAATGVLQPFRPAVELAVEVPLGALAGVAALYLLDREGFAAVVRPVRTRIMKLANEKKEGLEIA